MCVQVQCKAVVCSTYYKNQDLCATLKEICPEIDSSTGGAIQSPRSGSLCFVLYHELKYTKYRSF